jgi:glycosyltransferase involved in cell wall biosynthesis
VKEKVAFDPQVFSFQVYGGVSRYFCEIAQLIEKSKTIDIKIVAPFYVCNFLKKMNQKIVLGFEAPKISYLKLFFRLCSMAFGHLYLLWLNPRIIHETYFFPYALGSKKAIRVLTVYDMVHEKFPSTHFSQDKAPEYKAMAVARADHIICISETTKRDLIELLSVDPKKISVIYLGHSAHEPSLQDCFAIDKSLPPRYLLYVGQRSGYKNFKNFIQAYAQASSINTQFDIVCFGGGAFTPEESNLFQNLKISPEKIKHFSGGDDVLAHLYRKASAFIYPSQYEGFGLPPLEAMGNDCPVICSNAGSIPEVVGDAGEYFDPHDVNDIKTMMEKVLLDPKRLQELKILGRQRLNLFSWERCASETVNLYSQLALRA